MLDVRISVQAVPGTLAAWLDLARTLESAGFDALLVGDHPGDGDPLVALAATTTLSLSTYVIRLGVREPHHVADAAATLDRFAPGRVILGVGAGHTPAEWSALGRERPGPRERVQRLMESVEAVAQLLAGERMTAHGAQIDMRDAEVIRPDHAGPIRLLIGGGHPALLTVAAQRVDIAALSGLGHTPPDGHRHTVRWSPAALTRQLATVRRAAEHTENRQQALNRLVERVPGLSVADAVATPHALIGAADEIVDQLRRQAEELGVAPVCDPRTGRPRHRAAAQPAAVLRTPTCGGCHGARLGSGDVVPPCGLTPARLLVRVPTPPFASLEGLPVSSDPKALQRRNVGESGRLAVRSNHDEGAQRTAGRSQPAVGPVIVSVLSRE